MPNPMRQTNPAAALDCTALLGAMLQNQWDVVEEILVEAEDVKPIARGLAYMLLLVLSDDYVSGHGKPVDERIRLVTQSINEQLLREQQ